MKLARGLFVLAALSMLIPSIAVARDEVGKFDYYVLVLSWSPDFCATSANAQREPQCQTGKKYAFVLHGVWPQYERGYPQSCSEESLPTAANCDIFPSAKLCQHEWQKHGTCSGLGAQGYLDFSHQLKQKVHIPPAYQSPDQAFRTTYTKLQTDFATANPDLPKEAVAPYCSDAGRFLKEIFFCHNTAGKPRACSAEVLKRSAKSCARNDGFVVRSVR